VRRYATKCAKEQKKGGAGKWRGSHDLVVFPSWGLRGGFFTRRVRTTLFYGESRPVRRAGGRAPQWAHWESSKSRVEWRMNKREARLRGGEKGAEKRKGTKFFTRSFERIEEKRAKAITERGKGKKNM